MSGFFTALLSGALMSIQGVLNTEVTKQTGVWVAAGWVQLTAFFTCAVLWLWDGRSPAAAIFRVRPWYLLLGGLIGAFITATVIQSMDRLGPAKSTLLIVITQILVSYGIELFGLFGVEKVPFEWRKVFGAALAIAGIAVFRR